MKIIVAVDSQWGIGKNNDLLFSIPEDMKFFRETTTGKVVVVGRKTLESFPGGKPLKNRTNIVLSSKKGGEGYVTVSSIEELMCEIGGFCSDDVYVCGGASVYKTLLPYCDEALVTKVNANGDAEVFFPNLDKEEGWKQVSATEPIQSNGYEITFCKYVNKDKKVN